MSDSIVDACSIINLYAAGNLLTLLPPLGRRLHVPGKVLEESLYVRQPDPADASKWVQRAVELAPIIEAEVLHRCALEGEDELDRFVQLATTLDDGEAMCLAIAQSRGWTLATDDRKARRVAGELGVPLLSTPELLKQWATATAASEQAVARVLLKIQTFARFRPHRSLPAADWWEEAVKKLIP